MLQMNLSFFHKHCVNCGQAMSLFCGDFCSLNCWAEYVGDYVSGWPPCDATKEYADSLIIEGVHAKRKKENEEKAKTAKNKKGK